MVLSPIWGWFFTHDKHHVAHSPLPVIREERDQPSVSYPPIHTHVYLTGCCENIQPSEENTVSYLRPMYKAPVGNLFPQQPLYLKGPLLQNTCSAKLAISLLGANFVHEVPAGQQQAGLLPQKRSIGEAPFGQSPGRGRVHLRGGAGGGLRSPPGTHNHNTTQTEKRGKEGGADPPAVTSRGNTGHPNTYPDTPQRARVPPPEKQQLILIFHRQPTIDFHHSNKTKYR